jgi:RND superfamily putative drug exporter
MNMRKFYDVLLHHAKSIIVVGLIILLGAGVYGLGLFEELSDGNDNFFATGTPSAQANTKLKELFGTGDNESSIILLEAKSADANVRTAAYTTEAQRIIAAANPKSSTSYFTTNLDQFVSRDGRATYAVVTLDGTKNEQYQKLMDFSSSVKSDLYKVTIGGSLVGQHQTQSQSKEDLTRAELISLPILAILLLWFFRSPIAAAVPLVMSLLTIAGALGLARLLSIFLSVDTYSLNVITILGVGLSVDYSLLAVNRFREEMSVGSTPIDAARTTIRTAGRTIFFSGTTVIICLLSLLFFPVGFMHSVAIGGATAVATAVLISTLLLPLALRLIGSAINKWSLHSRTSTKGWTKRAHMGTKYPWIALSLGVIIIAALVWPVRTFQTQTFDWHVLPSNQSAYYVGKLMNDRFDQKTTTLTVLVEFPSAPTSSQLCSLAQSVKSIDGVDSIRAAYMPSAQLSDCVTMGYVLKTMPTQAAKLAEAAASYTSGRYARVDIVPKYGASDVQIRGLVQRLKSATYDGAVGVSVTGTAAQARDTLDTYMKWLPYAAGVIALAMIVTLSILLGSIILPLQAIVINSIALVISLGVLIMIFQYGWAADLLNMNTSGGFELSIPILIFVIAFGLSMDYAVFLYSRMHEVYDQTNDPERAIVGGVVKTGPIITAAALLLFAVVAAFATSRISIIQQVGVGLGVAVLVDAFFVRIFFVPAVMKLFGRVSWWGPKWLKKRTIKHE